MARLTLVLHARITIVGRPACEPVLFAANHISWLDIPCLLSAVQAVFVSKQEVAQWPVIGRLTTCAGTILIERGKGSGSATLEISSHLSRNESVVIFPEGTSTDGSDVRVFHPRLFAAAISTGATIQPIAIRYPGNSRIRSIVPFIGEDAFVPHLWRILGQDQIPVELHFLSQVSGAQLSRREMANQAHLSIRDRLTRWCTESMLVSSRSLPQPANTLAETSLATTQNARPGHRPNPVHRHI